VQDAWSVITRALMADPCAAPVRIEFIAFFQIAAGASPLAYMAIYVRQRLHGGLRERHKLD